MAKSSKTNARKKRQAAQAQAAVPEGMSRRRLLQGVGFGAVGVLALAGAGYAGLGMVRQHEREHDLSRIGNGKPVVVQVHDPQCPTCTALQRQTRRAMKQFDDDELVYLVADITQPEGQVFARRHNVPHVTLVLMDGRGVVVQVLSGMRQRSELEPVFAAHFAAHKG
ncbi:MAG: thioredoxin family protein [Sulfitobacter sp.]